MLIVWQRRLIGTYDGYMWGFEDGGDIKVAWCLRGGDFLLWMDGIMRECRVGGLGIWVVGEMQQQSKR